MRATVKWLGEHSFEGETQSGNKVPMEPGTAQAAASPMELLLIGAGGCSSYDVVDILKKSRQDITGCQVEIQAERAEQPPRVFTRIHFHFVVTGRGLRPDRVERAIALSAEKYCSASIMLGKTAAITHDFEIREA